MKQIDRLIKKARSFGPDAKTIVIIEYPDGRLSGEVPGNTDKVIFLRPASKMIKLS